MTIFNNSNDDLRDNYVEHISTSLVLNVEERCDDLGSLNIRYVWAAIYIGLGIIGLFGNAAVMAVILRVIFGRGLVTNVYIYVLCLSTVDFAYSATGPFIVVYMIRGTWTFGDTLCRVMYICEGLNKTLSIYLLVILSGDRYLAACRPYTSTRYRSVKAALIGLSTVAIAVIFTNIPIYMFTAVKTSQIDSCQQCGVWFPIIGKFFDKPSSSQNTNDSNDSNAYALPQGVQWSYSGTYYLILLLTLYYVMPAGMITAFYANIVKRLRQQHRLLRRTSSRHNGVTKSVLTVVAFYFLCWTPYWCLQSIITFWPQLQYANQQSFNVFVYLAYSVYALPYANSCLDPVLYAFLNKRLWIAYSASRAGRRRLPRITSSMRANLSIYELTNADALNGHHNIIMPANTVSLETVVEQLQFFEHCNGHGEQKRELIPNEVLK